MISSTGRCVFVFLLAIRLSFHTRIVFVKVGLYTVEDEIY